MTEKDRPAFAQLMTDAMVFYRRDMSRFALGVWWEACQAFDIEQVAQAITQHAMDPDGGKFAPMPADIVKQLHGTRNDRSLMAWSLVYEAIRYHGAYASVRFADPATQLAIHDMGGWVKLCTSKVDELQFVQKRFCDFHRSYSGRTDLREIPELAGIHAQDPRRLVALEPVVIGTRPQQVTRRLEGGTT